MPIPKVSGFADRSNYCDFSGGNENLLITGARWHSKYTTTSLGIGFDIKDHYKKGTHSESLAFEGKIKSTNLQLSDRFSTNVQVRERLFVQDESLQSRISPTLGFKINNKWSAYLQGHLTNKHSFREDVPSDKWTAGGGWGITYNNGKGFSISAEAGFPAWQNLPIRKWSSENAFPQGNTKSDLACYGDDNKMINFILSYNF